MEAAYFTAAIPEPYQVLGLRLKPLSLGRYQRLNRFGCAFVSEGDAVAKLSDLVLGVLICSMDCDEFDELLASPDCKRILESWGTKVGEFDIVEKCKLFAQYIADGSVCPKFWYEESGGQSGSGAHWSHILEVTLRSELGWTQGEIDDKPLTKALADYFRFAETKGAIRLMTPEEILLAEANGP